MSRGVVTVVKDLIAYVVFDDEQPEVNELMWLITQRRRY